MVSDERGLMDDGARNTLQAFIVHLLPFVEIMRDTQGRHSSYTYPLNRCTCGTYYTSFFGADLFFFFFLQGAVVGSSLGRLHWPGSRRTLEGSASVFLSTLASLALVSSALARRGGRESDGVGGWRLFGGQVGWAELATSLAWPAALVSLMEAFTTQVFGEGACGFWALRVGFVVSCF